MRTAVWITRRARGAGNGPRSRDDVAVFAAVSLLLGYPDEQLHDQLPALEAVAAQIAEPAGGHLAHFVAHLRRTPAAELASSYVTTFDLNRQCCLYLTYYTFGDTRRRGMALLAFNDAYRRAGFVPPEDELPDHLAVVCGFAALSPDLGRELLIANQAGIEALGLALGAAGSPYLRVLDALRASLPEPAERDVARALALAREGPPAETVGLEPFAPPAYMQGGRP